MNPNHTIEVTPEALSIKEFKDIWLRDKKTKKETAIQELSYVYFMADYMSVYNGYEEEEKERQIQRDVFGEKTWSPDSLVKTAIDKYEKLQATPSMRFLKAARRAAQALITYFEEVDFSDRDVKGQPIYKVNDVVRALGDSSKVVDALDKWEKKVQKEQLEETKITGGGQKGIMEDPDEDL